MNRMKKVSITVGLFLILTALVYSGYKILAQSTNEMISEGDGLPPSFPYITYDDLINERDTLCCGKGITLIGYSRTIVTSGGRSQSEPYLTMNDIGKKIFEETQNASGDVTSDNFVNPYAAATSYTYGFYEESEKQVATPEEAYILAEISENVPGEGSDFYNVTNEEYTGDISDAYFYNVFGTVLYGVDIDEDSGEPQKFVAKNEENGKYYYVEITDSGSFFPYTYVQYAWWKTPAGGNSSQVQSTPLSQEAKAFEEYIKKVAKRDANGNIVYESRTIEVRGKTATVQAPVIDYKISHEDENAKVEYDKDKERYLIGPFKLNYYEESVTTERGTVDFSAIIDAELYTNLGKVDNTKWFFKYNDRTDDDKSTFPHNGEEFYIVLDYEENARFIADLKFSFKYMNAGGEFTKLDGKYFKASWEPQSEAIWCGEGAKDCPCGGHHTSEQKDGDGKVTCSGGAKKCSHGYYHNHIVKWNYWLELEDLDPNTSQPLAQVYVGARWYEDAEYHLNIKHDGEPEELIRLTIPMEGEVWIDKNPDKKNPQFEEGTRQDGEDGYKNAEVYIYKVLKDKSGNIKERKLQDIYDEDNKTKLEYPLYTDENGHYKVPNINVPGTGAVNDLIENGLSVSYDVEFKFDGQHYEASKPLPTANGDPNKYISASKEEKVKYEKDSIASENAEARDEYNKKFTEIYGGNPMTENGDTTGYATNGQDKLTLEYTSKEFSLPDNTNTRRLSTLTVLDKDEHIIDQYKMAATTGNTGVYYPVNNKISVSEADDVKELSVIEDEKGRTVTYKTIYNYMMHINLAVKPREKADLSVFKDLYKAEILVNEKELTKTYNKYVDVEDEANREALETQIEACKIGKYTIDLHSSDYEYRSTVYDTSAEAVRKIKADTDLKVYLTYRIAINNESAAKDRGLDATINMINDYYDATFTLVNDDITANVLNNDQDRIQKVVAEKPYYRIVKADETPKYTYWSDGMSRFTCNDENKKVNDKYKKMNITAFKDTKLAAGEQLELFVTFEVDKDGYKGTTDRPNLLGEKNNVAEIANYSIFYDDGKVAGIIDRDSAPDNIDLKRNVKEWYEDDTESAPATKIQLYRYNREINGNVWEDKEAISLLYDQKVANGTMDSDESGIKDIDVQVVEKIQIDGIEYEKIWSEDDFPDLTDEEKKEYRLKNVTTDDKGYYYLKGMVAGNYVVRFKYGNKEATVKYNGQDYKNTAYQTGMTNEDGTPTLDNEWQDLRTSKLNEARISDARDYELQRMKVVAYSRYINNPIGTVLESADQAKDHTELIKNTQMVANTAKLNIEIEHQDYIDYGEVKLVDGLKEYTYYVKNIDFGLERRSPTVIDIDKKISKVSLYKEDGKSLELCVVYNEDGTINKSHKDNKNLEKLVHLDSTPTTQGFEYIPIEGDYKNGAMIKIEYQIKVTNNSEVDWTGKLASFETSDEIIKEVEKLEKSAPYVSGEMITYGEYVGLNYYNNKNNDIDKIVRTKVEQIIDYIDNDASSDKESNTLIENSSWDEAELSDLISGKVLAEEVYTKKNGETRLLDSKGRDYITDQIKNILLSRLEDENPSAITKLVPTSAAEKLGKASTGKIRVVIAKQLSEENSDNDLYNNIAEVVRYSNTVGRRDEQSVPGNAQVARGEFVAATGYLDGTLVKDYEGAKEVTEGGSILHLNGERDSSAPSYVTITDPTGIALREYRATKQAPVVFIVIATILAAGLILVKAKVFNKKEEIKLLNK